MSRINIIDFKEGDAISGIYVLANHAIKQTKTGSDFVSISIKDKTGTIPGNMWSVPSNISDFKDGDLIYVTGTVSSYQNALQFKFTSIDTVLAESVSLEDKKALVPMIEDSPEELYAYLMDSVTSIKDESLRNLGKTILDAIKDKFMVYPASKTVHHSEIGGLLLHSTEVVKYIKAIHEVTPWFDVDITVIAGLLHDFAKLREFSLASTGLVSDYSRDGILLGHIFMGADEIGMYCKKCNVDKEKTVLLQHMILSHHGEPEFGSPIRPLTMEAFVLHMADDLSAKMHVYKDAVADIEPGSFSDKMFALDGSRIYKPVYCNNDEPTISLFDFDKESF